MIQFNGFGSLLNNEINNGINHTPTIQHISKHRIRQSTELQMLSIKR